MKNLFKIQTVLIFALTVFTFSSHAQLGAWNPKLESKTEDAVEQFRGKNEKLESYFDEAYGYVVFPTIGKGGIVLGGAHGRGLVFEQGQIIGEAKITQLTLGLQWGGQSFSEIIFFKDEEALNSFKNSNLEFAGQTSAVAATVGASADIAYENGVAVFSYTKGGLMYEAALGGQKFKFLPVDNADESLEASVDIE